MANVGAPAMAWTVTPCGMLTVLLIHVGMMPSFWGYEDFVMDQRVLRLNAIRTVRC